nr:nudix hydrolase 3 [Ipomoea batatas]
MLKAHKSYFCNAVLTEGTLGAWSVGDRVLVIYLLEDSSLVSLVEMTLNLLAGGSFKRTRLITLPKDAFELIFFFLSEWTFSFVERRSPRDQRRKRWDVFNVIKRHSESEMEYTQYLRIHRPQILPNDLYICPVTVKSTTRSFLKLRSYYMKPETFTSSLSKADAFLSMITTTQILRGWMGLPLRPLSEFRDARSNKLNSKLFGFGKDLQWDNVISRKMSSAAPIRDVKGPQQLRLISSNDGVL